METNDLIRRAEDLAARCERTSSVTATAFLTPAERMELQNTPSLRGTVVVYSGGGTECERTCAFFLPFYLTAEELDPSEYISAVHFRSFFGEPGHRDYLGALLALGVRREWVGDIRIRGAEAWVFCLPSVVKTLAELDRAGRYTVRGEEIALADVPEEEVKTETVSFTVQSLRHDRRRAHPSRQRVAQLCAVPAHGRRHPRRRRYFRARQGQGNGHRHRRPLAQGPYLRHRRTAGLKI